MKLTKMSGSRWLALAGVTALAVFLAACGGGNDKESTTTGGGKEAPPDQQVLTLRSQEPKTIDPNQANFDVEISVIKQLFSGLFTFDEGLNVVANLAAEMPTTSNGGVSSDGKTYTIKMKDTKWSDGKPLTADDVVYSIKRMLDPKLAAPYASFYYAIVGAEDFNSALGTKAKPLNPSDAELKAMQDKLGVQAKDKLTVVFTLTQPDVSFLQKLALWAAFPVRQDIVEKFGDKWTEAGNLIGNGPFLLKEWVHNDHISFAANTNWFGPKVKLQKLTYRLIDDDATAFAAYQNNELDMTTVPLANRRDVMNTSNPLNKELTRQVDLSTYALEYNNEEKPFDNPNVRKALGTAIDRKAFVDAVLQGVGVPTTSWIPSGMPGYDASVGKQYDFNVEKAKQYLSQAGYANGQGLPKITFMMRARDTDRVIGQFLQEQFKKNLNIDIDVEYVDSATYQSRYTKSQFQVVFGGWGADWPYPDNWLSELFRTGATSNQYQYSNTKVDDLLKQAGASADAKKALDLFQQAHKVIIDDDQGISPVYNRETFCLLKPKVKDLIKTGLDGYVRGDYFFWKTYISQ